MFGWNNPRYHLQGPFSHLEKSFIIFLLVIKQKIFLYFPVIVWCGLIFALSNRSTISTAESYAIDFAIKKLAHFIEYFILGVFVYRATKNIWISILFCITYAISDEFHQSFIPGREPRGRDVIIDSLGSITAVIAWNKLSQKTRLKLKK